MTGKAEKLPNITDRLVRDQKAIKELYGYARLGTSPLALATPIISTAQAGGSSPSAQNVLETSHTTMNGPIAFSPKLSFVNDGRVDISFENADAVLADNGFSSNVLVTGTGTPDDVKFIDGAIADGQMLWYQGTNQQVQNLINANLLPADVVGDDTTTTIIVTITDTGTLIDGDTINVVGTDNFDIQNTTVENLIVDTSFTYELDTIGSSTSEGATIQDGNILTNDGEDVELDGTLSTNGVPFVLLKFDTTALGFGAWRVDPSINSGGGTGLSEPVILTVNEITASAAPVVDWDLNPNHITLDQAATFSFDNLPTSGKYEGVLVIIDIDATGGFDSPEWPASLTNPPTVSTTALTRTSVMLYTIDGGTTVTHATSVGSSTGGGALLSNVTIDTNKDWLDFSISNLGGLTMNATDADIDFNTNDALNIDRLQLSGGTTTATGANDISWYLTDDPTLNPTSLVSNVGTTDSWLWSSGNITKMILTDALLEKRNVTAPAFQLYNTRTAATGTAATISMLANTVGTGTELAMGFIVADTESLALNGAGSLHFGVLIDGAANTFMEFNDGNDSKIDFNHEIDMNSNQISELADPISDQQAATKKYVDDNAGVQNTIIDGNTSFTANGTTDTLTGTFDGDSDQVLQFGKATALFESSAVNYITSYSRNDSISGGTVGDFISTFFHKGFNDNATPQQLDYVTEFTTIKSPIDGAEDGQYNLGLLSKGSDKTAYQIEGGAGLINTNILNSFFGSMILKSDQDGDEAILRLTRNDTTPADDDEIGTIQFFAQNNNVTPEEVIYGSLTVEIADVSDGSENGRFAVDLINGVSTDRMFVADSLTNTITLSPTSSFNYLFQTTGLTLPDDLIFDNGFKIENTDATTTTFDVPSGEILSFAESSTEVGKYDGDTNNWVFNPANDVQLTPTVDIDLKPGGDIIVDPSGAGDMKLFCDIDMDSGDQINFSDVSTTAGTSTQTLPAQPDGFIIIKVSGASKRVPFYVP